MKIQWLGHACFKLTFKDLTVITDPYDNSIGYKPISESCDIVTISHEHFDHNYLAAIKGTFKTIRTPGEYKFNNLTINAYLTYHDKNKGTLRGTNLIFKFQYNNLSICHLGDLGEVLTKQTAKQLGKINILLIPTGGTYTINSKEAKIITDILFPDIIIPMHYKTKVLSFPLEPVENFTKLYPDDQVKIFNDSTLEITSDNLSTFPKIAVLNYTI